MNGTPAAARPVTFVWLLLGAACLFGFHEVGTFYGGFYIRQGGALQSVHPSELVFWAWYLLFGSLAVGFVACVLDQVRHSERLLRAVRFALVSPVSVAFACALIVLGSSLAFRRLLLLDQVVTDDELTYDFIASTLLHGRVWNAPPIAPEFLKNQFVVATEHAWYGKYPIGHPLVLALGKALHVQTLVVPLLGAASVLLTFAVGRRLIGDRHAALACMLLALSPHYVWTHATQLSQPTTTACMLLAMLGMLRLLQSERLGWAALSGAALGYGVLARPAPGLLFVVAALVAYLAMRRPFAAREQLGRRLAELGLAGAGVAAGIAGVLLVNYAQSGDPFTSGYHTIHGHTGALVTQTGVIAASVGAALLRENFWLFGWPLSLAFVPLARFGRGGWLLWGMIAAEGAYRVLVPKTVVSITGPTYTLEIVPLLCLSTAAGMARCVELLARVGLDRERVRRLLAAAVLASTLVALVLFVPPQARSIHRAALGRANVYQLLRDAGVKRAVVFASMFVVPTSGVGWAYSPPNPPPSLDGDLVFLRMPRAPDAYDRVLSLWQTRFSDRRGMLLIMTPGGLVLRELPVQPDNPLPREIVWHTPR